MDSLDNKEKNRYESSTITLHLLKLAAVGMLGSDETDGRAPNMPAGANSANHSRRAARALHLNLQSKGGSTGHGPSSSHENGPAAGNASDGHRGRGRWLGLAALS